MIRKIASDVILEEAFGWLCQRRKDYSPNSDVWDLRRNWDRTEPEVQKILECTPSGKAPRQNLHQQGLSGL